MIWENEKNLFSCLSSAEKVLIVTISAVKRLIVINRIQNKSFCLHNICVCSVYIYYVYINTCTYSIYFEKYIHVFTYKYI